MRPLGIPRRRWEDNIKMDLQELRCVGVDWIDVAQDRDRGRAEENIWGYDGRGNKRAEKTTQRRAY